MLRVVVTARASRGPTQTRMPLTFAIISSLNTCKLCLRAHTTRHSFRPQPFSSLTLHATHSDRNPSLHSWTIALSRHAMEMTYLQTRGPSMWIYSVFFEILENVVFMLCHRTIQNTDIDVMFINGNFPKLI